MGQPVYVVVDLELCHPHLWPGTRDGGARLWKSYLGCSTRTLIGLDGAPL